MPPAPLLVRNRAFALDGRPTLSAASARKIMDTRNGSACCCSGTPPCNEFCTAVDCGDVCLNPPDKLLDVYYERIQEDWQYFGTRSIPPCNTHEGPCAIYRPPICSNLNLNEKYFPNSKIERFTVTLLEPVLRIPGCMFIGRFERDWKHSGKLTSSPPPEDCLAFSSGPFSEVRTIETTFSRCTGGFQFGVPLGVDDFTNCMSDPDCQQQNCTPVSCDALRLENDMLCALLPHDCNVGDMFIDTGCVQLQQDSSPRCNWKRVRHTARWNIQKGGI